MSSELIAKHREGAEVYQGPEMCKEKFYALMDSICMPRGIVPLDNNVTEMGYNKASGFMWVLRTDKLAHQFKGLKGKVHFEPEVTAFLEKHKMKQVSGVKVKELMITLNMREIYISDPASGKITFVTLAGIKKNEDISSFEV